jgi:hypothetical protein
MGFLSPWFLGGLLAVGLPLYVHLLRQHRSEPVKFSSLMFIERRTQSSVKHRRLKYLALLAMRLAIILLLALMFANPFIKRGAVAAGTGRKHLVIAVDNSFSMRAGDRFERAKQQAMDALSGLGAADRGQVFSFASNVAILTQPTNDREELRRAIAGLQPGDGRSAYGEIARTLRAMGQPDGLPVEAHVITDIQRTSMPTPFAELAVPSTMRLMLHPVADRREPNWYIESVNAPRSVFQARKVRVQAVVAGAGTDAAETMVELALNGKVLETKPVKVPENGRATVEFFLPDAAYGLNRGEVRIPGRDRLPQDDRFPFSIERKEAARILFVYDSRSARSVTYYKAAIEAVPDAGYAVEAVPAEQAANVSPDKYASVVLSDTGSLPRSLEDALAEYVKKGGGVLIALGPSSAAARRVPVSGAAISESRYASREGERFLAAGEVDGTHPAVGRTGGFDGVRFYQTVRLDGDKARVIAKLADSSPLLLERRIGEGRVLVFASTFDNLSNDLPLHASFIPFVEQSAHYLGGVESAPAQYAVDSFVELRAARDSGTAIDVLDPDGKRALSLKEAASTQSFRLPREGFYELRRANGRHELIAAHADRRESDLDVVPKETLALWQGTGMTAPGAGGPADETQKPYSLWWYFALALLVASLAESFFASRYLSAEQQPVAVRKQAA